MPDEFHMVSEVNHKSDLLCGPHWVTSTPHSLEDLYWLPHVLTCHQIGHIKFTLGRGENFWVPLVYAEMRYPGEVSENV